jgi:hypothetical protein
MSDLYFDCNVLKYVCTRIEEVTHIRTNPVNITVQLEYEFQNILLCDCKSLLRILCYAHTSIT